MRPISLTFLGTGTSQGVPVVGCDCEVCQSVDSKDKRLRSSVMIQSEEANVVIDCGPDFRQQMLREGVTRVDGIVLTHEHMDHVSGLDDVRPFNFMMRSDMPLYATERVQGRLQQQFAYAFAKDKYPGSPGYELRNVVENVPFQIADQTWMPILGQHGTWPVMGYRIGDLVYLTDVSGMSVEQLEYIKGAKVLIVNALRREPHIAHFSFQEAIDFAQATDVPMVFFTHASHHLGKQADITEELPEGFALAYDGLRIQI